MTFLLRCRLVGLAVLLLVGCGAHRQEEPGASALVWPPAPEQPRVAFVRTFSSPGDLGIGRGFFGRLEDFLLGDEQRQLVRPMAVAAWQKVIYVADPGVQGIHRFDLGRGDYTLIRGPDKKPILSPVGLAVGGAGEIYVTDSKLAQVFVIQPGGKAAVAIPLGAELGQPTGVAFDGQNQRLLVVDTAAHQVFAFGLDGKYLGTMGKRGDGPGEFNYPTLLWRSAQGRLYITDSLNFRVQILEADGRFIGAVGKMGDGIGYSPRPKGVAIDSHGHVYVVDSLLHSLQIFDQSGRFLLPVGQQGQERGEFWLPTGVFVGDDDQIYVADSYNRRIQILRYIGGAA